MLWVILSIFHFNGLAGASVKVDFELTINDSLQNLLTKGQREITTKNYETAIKVYKEALKVATENSLSADASFIYKKIGGIYYSQKKYHKSKENYLQSIFSDSLSQNAADSHFNVSLIYGKEKLKDSLLFHLQKSLYLYSNLEDTRAKFNTFRKAGIVLKNNGIYDLAVKYLIEAYKGFDNLGDNSKKADVCNSIASTQRQLGNLEISKQYYYEALELRKGIGDKKQLSFGYNNLANLYKELKVYDSAEAFYNKAIYLQNELDRPKDLGKSYYNLATINYLQDNLSEAKSNYKKSLQIKKSDGDSASFAISYNELALIGVEQWQNNHAKQYLDSASASLNIEHNQDVLLRYYEVQSSYHKSIGDYQRALDYNEKYTALYTDLFQERQAKTVQELQERFESKQKLEKINELTQGGILQKETITKQKKNIKLLLLLSLMLLLLGISTYFLLKQRQKSKEQDLELHRLESIFKSQEVIKERISKDLHDIVTTSYDGIRLKILALPNAKNPDIIGEKIVKEIAEINNEIRLISHRISPLGDKVKNTPLSKIIVAQLTEFQYFRKIFIDLHLPLPNEIDSFKLESQTNLYGIILEALNNIEKHSQATEVVFIHKNEGGHIEFVISDNGVGFEIQEIKGIGLINMKQRAELLDGFCNIESSDIGTKVTINIPIKSNMA